MVCSNIKIFVFQHKNNAILKAKTMEDVLSMADVHAKPVTCTKDA